MVVPAEAAAAGVSFPVVFFDGQQDINVGYVLVSASMQFKDFQSIVSKKIGISSHQFTVYLANYQKSRESSTKIRRRIPITGKVNFGALSGEKSSFFLAVLKKSRRERRRKGHDSEEDFGGIPETAKNKGQQSKKNFPPENVMLLRRNAGVDNEQSPGLVSPIMDRFEYGQRIRKMQLEKEKYLITMGLREPSLAGDGVRNATGDAESVFCRYCQSAKKKGKKAGFHCCARDAVTAGFRSQAGPIARPVKESG